jgi:hypothetical protein
MFSLGAMSTGGAGGAGVPAAALASTSASPAP